MNAREKRSKEKRLFCSVKGCERGAFCKGFCHKHYQQMNKHGKIIDDEIRAKRNKICKVEECDRKPCAYGYCQKHYEQFRKHKRITDGEHLKGRKLDLVGKRFGRLLVLRESEKRTKAGNIMWVVECACGTIKEITGSCLLKGTSKSCGCLARELSAERNRRLYRLDPEEHGTWAQRSVLRTYKGSASKRKIKFELTLEKFLELCTSSCFYCGREPSFVQSAKYGWGEDFIYNGIDRVDNNIGYNDGNVVSCCRDCNIAKRNKTLKEFVRWVGNIYENLADMVAPGVL